MALIFLLVLVVAMVVGRRRGSTGKGGRPISRRSYLGVLVAVVVLHAVVLSQGTKLLVLIPLFDIPLAVAFALLERATRRLDPVGYQPPWRRR